MSKKHQCIVSYGCSPSEISVVIRDQFVLVDARYGIFVTPRMVKWVVKLIERQLRHLVQDLPTKSGSPYPESLLMLRRIYVDRKGSALVIIIDQLYDEGTEEAYSERAIINTLGCVDQLAVSGWSLDIVIRNIAVNYRSDSFDPIADKFYTPEALKF